METSALPQYNHHGAPRRRRLSLPVPNLPTAPARTAARSRGRLSSGARKQLGF
jgi:hypothetical protein